MNETALITIVHDPEGINIPFYKTVKDRLNHMYSELYITLSEESSPELRFELENSRFRIKTIPKKGVTHARHEVLNFGMSGNSQYYHYCDFDRLLTWAIRYPDELQNIVEDIPNYHYIVFGRTERAFYTHPLEWTETEKISNKVFSLEFGQDMDITAGSCGFSKQAGEYLIKHSRDKMTDAEWPMIIHKIGRLRVNYKAVEGLEYQEEISGHNETANEADKWFGRLNLCYIICESAIKSNREYGIINS